MSLAEGQPLESHRHDVDTILAIQAGIHLLIALDCGFLTDCDSTARERDKKALTDIAAERARLMEECQTAAMVAGYQSGGWSEELLSVERTRRAAEFCKLDDFQLATESGLDLQTEKGQTNANCAWNEFVRLELILKNPLRFRPDASERGFGIETLRQRSAKDVAKREVPGKTKDEQYRYSPTSPLPMPTSAEQLVQPIRLAAARI